MTLLSLTKSFMAAGRPLLRARGVCTQPKMNAPIELVVQIIQEFGAERQSVIMNVSCNT